MWGYCRRVLESPTCSCVTCSGEETIGRGSPEWFEENVDVLEPLIL